MFYPLPNKGAPWYVLDEIVVNNKHILSWFCAFVTISVKANVLEQRASAYGFKNGDSMV